MVTCIQVIIGQNVFCRAIVHAADTKSGLEKTYANLMHYILFLAHNQKIKEYDKEIQQSQTAGQNTPP